MWPRLSSHWCHCERVCVTRSVFYHCLYIYLLQISSPTPMESSMMRAATDTMMIIITGFCSLEASATGKDRNTLGTLRTTNGKTHFFSVSQDVWKTWLFRFHQRIKLLSCNKAASWATLLWDYRRPWLFWIEPSTVAVLSVSQNGNTGALNTFFITPSQFHTLACTAHALHSITTVYIKCESAWDTRNNYKIMVLKAEKTPQEVGSIVSLMGIFLF